MNPQHVNISSNGFLSPEITSKQPTVHRHRRTSTDDGDADSSEPEFDHMPIPGPLTVVTRRRARGRSLRTNVLLRGAVASPIEDTDDEDENNGELGEPDTSSECGEPTQSIYTVNRSRSASTVIVLPGGVTRRDEMTSIEDTVYWGWVLLFTTWIVVVLGVGSVTGIWDWAWGGEEKEEWTQSISQEGEFPIPGYYLAICILTCIMAWVWVTVAWVGMKYFKHAKIQG